MDDADATVTSANELPPLPTVEVGSSVNDVGGCCGVNVSCACVVAPAKFAVTVAVVFFEALVRLPLKVGSTAPVGLAIAAHV